MSLGLGNGIEPQKILITGSRGLVGTAIRAALCRAGHGVVGLDHLDDPGHDVRDAGAVRARMTGCSGVVHLAAVSRVEWAERDPEAAWSTNVGGTQVVLDAALDAPNPPWVLFASSREVYGHRGIEPTPESAPLRPLNVYGRAKVAGEEMLQQARDRGLVAGVVRLSNVYGATADHIDRVVPAFARAAVLGEPLRVDGREHRFDFTHLDDTTRGLLGLIGRLMVGVSDDPVHLVTGRSTSLGELAQLAIRCAGPGSSIHEAPPRSYDVSRFCGDPSRAASLLDWHAAVGIDQGMEGLVEAFRRNGGLG